MVGSFFLYQPTCIVLKKAPDKCSTTTNILTTGIFKLLKVRTRTIRHSSIFKQFVKRKVQQNHTHTLSASVTREPCTQKVYFTLCFAMNCCRSKQKLKVGILIEIEFRIAIYMLLCTPQGPGGNSKNHHNVVFCLFFPMCLCRFCFFIGFLGPRINILTARRKLIL